MNVGLIAQVPARGQLVVVWAPPHLARLATIRARAGRDHHDLQRVAEERSFYPNYDAVVNRCIINDANSPDIHLCSHRTSSPRPTMLLQTLAPG